MAKKEKRGRKIMGKKKEEKGKDRGGRRVRYKGKGGREGSS